jgi:hypothetical protein
MKRTDFLAAIAAFGIMPVPAVKAATPFQLVTQGSVDNAPSELERIFRGELGDIEGVNFRAYTSFDPYAPYELRQVAWAYLPGDKMFHLVLDADFEGCDFKTDLFADVCRHNAAALGKAARRMLEEARLATTPASSSGLARDQAAKRRWEQSNKA